MSKPQLSDPITLRLPLDILKAIERIAETSDRSRSWVMVRAMRLYLASEGAEILNVADGITQLDSGESEDMDDVIAQVEQIVRGNAA
ncbi:CopG family transcriptional regulator [Devosia sp. Root685]|uniref:CopG family ribbon-helix-helix protein n=1 Tax=Devosia sp. Root685 TaxID=1736587 RepID=UPI0006FBE7F0|nr:ribbon-helix-helix domain-containing protein [Devosia sp. Root685]KRA97483.1 CopG family transcriptional regulator [Devosia sp. Root685]